MFDPGPLEGTPVEAAGGGFVAGFASRQDAAAGALRRAFSDRPIGFAPADLMARLATAGRSDASPRHFSPADRAQDPTAGWDPLDPEEPTTAFIDPLAAAHAAGYAEGLAAARVAQDEAGARDRALIEGLVAQLAAGERVDRGSVAARLRETVLLLVGRIVGEAGVSADLLTARVAAAIDLLADASESAILRLNPEDVALVEGRLPQTVFAAGDPAVARGSFVLEAASTIVEDGPALWLEQLSAAIDKLPVPRA